MGKQLILSHESWDNSCQNMHIIKNRIKLYNQWQNGRTVSGRGIRTYLNKLPEAAVKRIHACHRADVKDK
jgi:hypothetical protein